MEQGSDSTLWESMRPRVLWHSGWVCAGCMGVVLVQPVAVLAGGLLIGRGRRAVGVGILAATLMWVLLGVSLGLDQIVLGLLGV